MDERARDIIASALAWSAAHVAFEEAVADLPPHLRGVRAEAAPHTPWELVEHIRIAQRDLIAFIEDPDYAHATWPDDYWPASPAPDDDGAWDASVAAVVRDRDRLQEVVRRTNLDLLGEIPWGEGQTYLRTILLAIDHTAYHVGQIVVVRRLLGGWPTP